MPKHVIFKNRRIQHLIIFLTHFSAFHILFQGAQLEHMLLMKRRDLFHFIEWHVEESTFFRYESFHFKSFILCHLWKLNNSTGRVTFLPYTEMALVSYYPTPRKRFPYKNKEAISDFFLITSLRSIDKSCNSRDLKSSMNIKRRNMKTRRSKYNIRKFLKTKK